MMLCTLISELQALAAAGHTFARVIDLDGNEVTMVRGPERPNADHGDDTSAVVLETGRGGR